MTLTHYSSRIPFLRPPLSLEHVAEALEEVREDRTAVGQERYERRDHGDEQAEWAARVPRPVGHGFDLAEDGLPLLLRQLAPHGPVQEALFGGADPSLPRHVHQEDL